MRDKFLMKRIKKYLPVYAIMFPGLLYFAIFHYVPMAGIVAAFKEVSPYLGIQGIIDAPWVGLKYFRQFFNSYYFGNIMFNTIVISFSKLLWSFPMSIIFALLLNELKNLRYKKIVQTISYLPHFISVVVMAGLITSLLSANGGLINEIIKFFGGEPKHFLGIPQYFRTILVTSNVWKTVGWGSIIYLAAITGVDTSLYEAAIVDGANRLQRAWHITLPSIVSIIVVMLILRVGNILDAGFQQVLLLYSPSVYSVGDIIDTYVYREGIVNLKYSLTTAVGFFKSVASLLLIVLTNHIAHRLGEQGIW